MSLNKKLLLQIQNLSAGFSGTPVLKSISMDVLAHKVLALIGPSGCGKSTFLRCLNRMHEEVKGAYVSGEVYLNKENIYSQNMDPVLVRRQIGMVFQKANPFPGFSIFDNVAVGLRLMGIKKSILVERVETSLKDAALWSEVKDIFKASGDFFVRWSATKIVYCQSFGCQSRCDFNG